MVLVLLTAFSTHTFAQFSVGLGLGTTTYWGDLNSPNNIANIKNNSGLAVSLNVVKPINRLFDFKTALTIGSFRGDDANSALEWQKQRNLSFKSTIIDASGRLNVKLINLNINDNLILTPYLAYGVSMFYFNPTAQYLGDTYKLRNLGTEGQGLPGFGEKYNRFDMSINTGGGFSLRINEKLSVAFDLLLYKTFTDYIDDVGRFYVSASELSAGNGEIASILGDRTPEYLGTGEPSTRNTGQSRGGKSTDYFISSMLSIMMDIDSKKGFWGGNKIKCPKF